MQFFDDITATSADLTTGFCEFRIYKFTIYSYIFQQFHLWNCFKMKCKIVYKITIYSNCTI